MRNRYKQLVEARALVLDEFNTNLAKLGTVLFHDEVRDVFVRHPSLDRFVFDINPETDGVSSGTTFEQLQSIPDQEVSLYGKSIDRITIYDNLRDIFQLFEESDFLDVVGHYGEYEFERENYVPEPEEPI